MKMNRKGAFMDALQGIGIGIVALAIIIGVGSIVLFNFGGTVACPSDAYPTWNGTLEECMNATGSSTNTTAPSGVPYTSISYMNTQLGSGGLAGWVPAIIALVVGLLFLGAFMFRKRGF